MAAPTTKKNKIPGPLRVILLVLALGLVLNVITEGELAEGLLEFGEEIGYHMGLGSGSAQPGGVSDGTLGDDGAGGSTSDDGSSTAGDSAGSGFSSGSTSADNNSGSSGSGSSSSGNSSSSSGSSGSSSGSSSNSSGSASAGSSGASSSGSQSTEFQATYGSGSRPGVPASSKNNVFLDARDQGISATLTGDVLITTIFVSDQATDWTAAEMKEIKMGHKTMTDAILAEAKAWGVELSLTLEYRTASVTQDLATASHNDWYQSALKSAGLTSTASTDLEKTRKVKEAPILFYLDLTGRAFAAPMKSKSTRPEYAVFYSDDAGCIYYRHELYHLFGAKDYYYPAAVKTLGESYFPDSVMMSAGLDSETDPLTAYLIGWTDQLSAQAQAFLQETNWITAEYMKEENAKETHTGYVENWAMDDGTYTGYLVSGVQQGQGTMIWNDGRSYTGNWDYGQFHGQGTYVWANGDSYQGNFNKGVREGTGRYTFASGAWYEGDFVNNSFHGQGTYCWTNGNRYVGQWQNDKRTGQGKLTYASGAWYEGDFLEGQFHGQGTFTWTNGDSYQGQWKNNQRHGQGTYTYADGSQKSGQWAENEFVG